MKIDNEFTVNVPIDEAWQVLTDLEGIAPCLPGAQLTGVDGDVYTGKVKIKVGPVVSEYAGTARFAEKDESTYHAVIDAKGKDSRGAGNASASIDARLSADGDKTIVTVNTDLNITGKIAQFGSGMIKEVSAKLLGQFAQNLETKLLAPAVAEQAPAGTTAEAGTAPEAAGAVKAGTAPEAAVVSEAEAVPQAVAAPARPRVISQREVEPVDIMSVAGSSVYKRVIPPIVGLALLVAVIVYLRRK